MTTDGNQQLVLRFQWEVGDLRPVESYWIGLMQGPWKQAILYGARFVSILVVVAASALLFPEAEVFKAVLLAIIASNSLWVYWAVSKFGVRALQKAMASPDWQVGTVRVIIARDGVRWADDVSETYTSWLGITDVETPDGSIWLKTGKASGVFIPSRILQKDGDRQLVLEMVERFREAPGAPSHVSGGAGAPLVRH